MAKHIIVLAGNIGAGKTSLTERLGGRMGWQTAFESVADNPYLPISTPTCTPGHFTCRSSSWATAPASTWSWQPRRSPPSWTVAFMRTLTSSPRPAPHEQPCRARLPGLPYRLRPDRRQAAPPDLLIYLRAPVKVLIERIHRRARAIEGGITSEYCPCSSRSTTNGCKPLMSALF